MTSFSLTANYVDILGRRILPVRITVTEKRITALKRGGRSG